MSRVTTTAGTIEGTTLEGGIQAFLGVPYAAPPVGPLRFRPPQPVAPWEGVPTATTLAPSCPQPTERPAGWPQEHAVDEDCLYLNVWTPGTDDGARPVMVWIHGGGYGVGSGSWPLYDGANLSRRGDVVVLSVNHRLGPFGYLHLDGLVGDRLSPDEARSSGNNGMLDLVAVLEWVRDEIHGFGGDAGNVTIMGESGGGAKVSTLLAMPAARGLFHRAIIQSGPGLRVTKPERATANAEGVLRSLGADSDVERLWSASADELLAASGAAGRMGLTPVLDGVAILDHPVQELTVGTAADVPVIVGCNRDEGAGGLPRDIDEDGLRARLAQMADTDDGASVERLLATYRHEHPDASLVDILSFAITDQRMRAGSIALAEAKAKGTSTPVWQYFFTYQLAGRAGHGYEIAFCLDNLGVGGTAPSEGRRRLADEMSEAWLAFARTGDPNHAGLVEWPPFTVPDRETMVFGPTSEVVDDPSRATRELWEEIAAARQRRR